MWDIRQVSLIEIMPGIISDATALKEKPVCRQVIGKLMQTVYCHSKRLLRHSPFNCENQPRDNTTKF